MKLASLITRCVDCGEKLRYDESGFCCDTCLRIYTADRFGVWDFRPLEFKHKLPDIFSEDEFLRWLKIFREQESKNWVIYKNAVLRFFAQAGHKIIARSIQKNKSTDEWILEIGAGTGTLLEHMPSHNFVAMDASLEGLRALKQRWPDAVCICGDVCSLPMKTGSFKSIVSIHTLEHLYFLAECLQEISRIMMASGRLHYVIPTEGGWSFSLGRKFITGPHLRRKYDLDVSYVMDREHINDAPRVIKFLKMHFLKVQSSFWPLPFLRFLSSNAMIHGVCHNPKNFLSGEEKCL